MKAQINITVPGTINNVRNSTVIVEIRKWLKGAGIENSFVDTVPGWGSLNQDWLEFETEIDSNWGWVQLSSMPIDFQNLLNLFLHHGLVIMMVRIQMQDGSWVPYS